MFAALDEAFVFDNAVVVDADGNEDDVSVGVDVVVSEHVVEEAHFGLAHASVVGEPAFEEDGLAYAFFGGHVYVALEDASVEGVAGVASYEEGAHGANEHVERPDLCPFADGVGHGGLFGDEVGHEHVVHVAAVVHDEDDGGFGVYGFDGLGIEESDADAVEEFGEVS